MRSLKCPAASAAALMLLLSGCNFAESTSSSTGATVNANTSSTASPGSNNAGTGGGTTTTPPADPVTATASVAGTVSVIAGAQRTLTVAFTSADGNPVSGLALSNTTLPAHWSGPKDFSCSATGSGSTCVLTLTYAPTAIESGTLVVGYTYLGDHTPPPGASISIPYAATATNNVVASAAPIGQITAASSTGTQSVSVNFTTDDGSAATSLTVAGLTSLPGGWSTATPAFGCAAVSNGSGCQLVLAFAPKSSMTGTLVLNYSYVDGSGTARTGALNLPYSTTAQGSVVATIAPAGQVNAVAAGGTAAVNVTFTTDDGQAARDLVLLAPLSASLPAGWSGSAGGVTCGTVSTGGGCQLALTYAPATLTAGTVTLGYGYTSPAGLFTTGSVNIPYAATSADNVVASAVPSGQLTAIVGQSAAALTVTFTTDDARTATQLAVTTDLTMLPAGWSSPQSAFTCAALASGSACQLPLSYAPSAAASGTLTLRYGYANNAGQMKTGSVNVPYRATTDDVVMASASPSAITVAAGASQALTLTFATDDGNPASALTLTTALATLPAGWSGPAGTFSCDAVAAGTPCQLTLSYAPTAAASGTLMLGFAYVNDAGIAKSGTVSVPYTATP